VICKKPTSIAEIIKKKKRKVQATSQYINLDFILGSTALIERLFSTAGHISSDDRQRLTPYLLEPILFLKVNRSYWDLNTKVAAMSSLRRNED